LGTIIEEEETRYKWKIASTKQHDDNGSKFKGNCRWLGL